MKTRLTIEECIGARLRSNEQALITFVTGGYPSVDFTVNAVERMLDAGSDIVEIGIPFSDPLADDHVIQNASAYALRTGTRTRDVLRAVDRVRRDGYTAPVILSAYVNTVYCYGIARFIEECLQIGVDGLVIPDLPIEERCFIQEALDETISSAEAPAAISLVPMVAPATDDSRIDAIVSCGSGLVYCESPSSPAAGLPLSDEATGLLHRVRSRTRLPVAVRLGSSDPEALARAAEAADAVVLDTAVVDVIAQQLGGGRCCESQSCPVNQGIITSDCITGAASIGADAARTNATGASLDGTDYAALECVDSKMKEEFALRAIETLVASARAAMR